MAATCPTTEAALQTGLLPAQERRKRCFAKASAYSGMHKKVIRQAGWVANPTNPQAV